MQVAPKTAHFIAYAEETLQTLLKQGLYYLPLVASSPPLQSQAPAVAVDDSLTKLADDLTDCQRCKLSKGRTHIVISRGSPKAELMFIGEGPGQDEDLKGEPFVGRAGQLLDKIIVAMGFSRDEVYVANIVKCRPPNNRAPELDEIQTCYPFLKRQILLIKPKVICALGAIAVQTLLQTEARISQLRGQFHDCMGIQLMPTFHPAYLLRNPSAKRLVWEDVQKISTALGRTPNATSKSDGREPHAPATA